MHPLDAGIILSVKVKYRKKRMQNVLARIANARCASEIANAVEVLQAIQ